MSKGKNPLEIKKELKEQFLKLVKEEIEVDKSYLMNSAMLETGFSIKTIKGIVDAMIENGLLREKDGKLYKAKRKK